MVLTKCAGIVDQEQQPAGGRVGTARWFHDRDVAGEYGTELRQPR